MPRRQKDPASGVIDYFKTAELSVAKTIHALAGDVIRERGPKGEKTAATPRKKKPVVGPGPVAQVGG